MIQTIIIEDELHSREVLRDMLVRDFKNVELVAVCANAEEGRAAIEAHQPDLVFSDIELENSSAFDMLQQLDTIDFEVTFTTAYEKYAIQAIKFSALDYLLKPFSLQELSEALNHYQQKQDKKQSARQFETLFYNLKHIKKSSKKIALPTTSGLMMVPLNEIIRCQSDVNYTCFFLINKKKIVVSKTLKEFEELLGEYDFIRVHNSHLINLHHVENYTRGEGGIVTMSDRTEVMVSRRKKDEFLIRLENI
jgi:two-component system, LytTR family, response regulator